MTGACGRARIATARWPGGRGSSTATSASSTSASRTRLATPCAGTSSSLGPQAPDWAETIERWLAHYAAHGVDTVRFGLVVLRRGFGLAERWFHSVEAAAIPTGEGGRQLQRILDAQDYLHGSALLPPRLADERFSVVDGHTITERNVFREGVYTPQKPALELDDGLGTLVTIEPVTLELLLALDGAEPLRDVLAVLAGADRIDHEELLEFGVETVGRLLELGLVVRL